MRNFDLLVFSQLYPDLLINTQCRFNHTNSQNKHTPKISLACFAEVLEKSRRKYPITLASGSALQWFHVESCFSSYLSH